ncbi:glycosyltransferase [Aneurinibacillus uraniidurans]|uniref:rhamnosyltransferase WsaF family glycosyltransferase n=1 Tax=Aneurinibacillus uraniidurans TaxID=2966586 RepID=UPI00234BD109|nr:glycosyltransferase [Aneurinibacillus sp. B1]WCN38095.1 glycosyltransferase [Aneurinibacillus sp. B1]
MVYQIVKKLKICKELIKAEGFSRGIRIIYHKARSINRMKGVIKRDICKFYSFMNLSDKECRIEYKKRKDGIIKLAWFIPDFGIGSGGHLNIFRTIKLLESYNVESDVYICGNSQWGDARQAKKIVDNYFFNLNSSFFIIDEEEIESIGKQYDGALATSWQTAYYVRAFYQCAKKFYFVQDFEPYFYAHGSLFAFAEETYNFGFYGITAGSWLENKLSREYKMKCKSFSFSYEKDLYYITENREHEVKKLFFYSRPPTERRGFELGVLALEKFCEKNPDVVVIMAGWDVSEYHLPFKHFNAGVVKLEELPDLYNQCDAALILSCTNLSLLPLELAACGCPVILNEGENNSWIDPDKELFLYVKPTIEDISKQLEVVMNNRMKTKESFVSRTREFLLDSSWEKEAKKVYGYITEFLEGK